MTGLKAAVGYIGCKVSHYDAQAIGGQLEKAGYEMVDFSDKADIYIINTCSVTNVGDKKSRQLIGRARNNNSNAVVVVTGCYSQTEPEKVKSLEGVDIVLGTKNLDAIPAAIEQFLTDKTPRCLVGRIDADTSYEEIAPAVFNGQTRVYVKIQDGCERYCSYCIIPYARGPVRSRPPKSVLDEMRAMAENGAKEIVLTGIHVASYGNDLDNVGLKDIIKLADQVDDLQRIRLSSLEPGLITRDFMESLASSQKFCPYFHLSLQSGCDRILKLMNRKYSTAEYLKAVQMVYDYFPEASVWTDVIAGFPGETEKDFDEGYTFLRQSGLHKMHVFPFSPKKGTPAAGFQNQVEPGEKNNRAAKLRELSSQLYNEFLQKNMGKKMSVLFEKVNRQGYLTGHTKNYIEVWVRGNEGMINTIRPVQLQSIIEKEKAKAIF